MQTQTSLDGWRPTARIDPRDRGDALRLPYVAAHYGKSLLWCASESMFAFLLTELAHLPPMAVGWVLAASFVLSGALDIGVGAALRQRLSTMAVCSRLQLTGATAGSAALLMLFSMPALHPPAPLMVAASIILLFRLAYAFVDLPQNAMLSLIVGDAARRSLASVRLLASGLAALTIGAWASVIVYSPDTQRPRLLILSALTVAAITIGSSAYLRWQVLARPEPARPSGRTRVAAAGRLPVAAWRLILVMLIVNLAAPIFIKTLPYYAAYQIQDPLLGSGAIASVSIGSVAGPPLWHVLLRGRSADFLLVAASLAMVAATGLFGVAGPGSAVLVPAAGLLGFSASGIGVAIWSAFGQVVADGSRGREGLAYGLFTAAAKVALALDAIGMGWLMSDRSYREPSNPHMLLYMTLPSLVAGATVVVLVRGWTGRSTGVNA